MAQAKLKKVPDPPGTRYCTTWRNKWLTSNAKTIKQMIATLRAAADELEKMAADGVTLNPDSGMDDDYAELVTTDPVVAKKYRMEKEEFEED